MSDLLRRLPSVDKLIGDESALDLIEQYGRAQVVETLRGVLDDVRARILSGEVASPEIFAETHLLQTASGTLERHFTPTLRPLINATGVIIHTNLGRAPLSESAQQAIIDVAASYNTLEFDLDTGKRGSRLVHAEALLTEITGAEAALVVNNNASATVLLLAGLAQGCEVIVSRGQLVEIGGGFRVPDVMRQSGARLVEVGTTNRTRQADYEDAITEATALLMRVHSSNFKQIGFTEETSIEELVEVALRHNIHAVDDLGSGALIDTAQFGLEHEPMVQESVRAGMGVVAFSGDKVLGGPQAGILLGKRELIDPLKKHPLARAIRADKLCLAALTATLDHYRRGDALEAIPVLRMMGLRLDELQATALNWMRQLRSSGLTVEVRVIGGESTVGGGSLPGATLPTALLALDVNSPDDFAHALRQAHTPVIPRISDGRVLFDPRTVLPGQAGALLETIKSTLV
ncbi:MAG: L-seryl-tRNA(Sec) selenium transferase [Aggregatilineales bacterium]